MSLAGYLKIDDIPGESRRVGHIDEIDVKGAHWKIAQASSAAGGSGRTQARAQVHTLTCIKETDAASPYLALACFKGKSIPEAVLMLRKDSGEEHLDYLQITMTRCIVTSFEMLNDGTDENDNVVTEKLGLSFEEVDILYTVQADDHSAGAEHQTQFNIEAGS